MPSQVQTVTDPQGVSYWSVPYQPSSCTGRKKALFVGNFFELIFFAVFLVCHLSFFILSFDTLKQLRVFGFVSFFSVSLLFFFHFHFADISIFLPFFWLLQKKKASIILAAMCN